MSKSSSRILAIIIAALLFIVVLLYLNHRLAVASPGGVDFMTHWVGTHALFQGESPYSKAVGVRVQTLYYGHPAEPGANEFLDPYMLHMEIIFAPFALIADYSWARAVWMTFLELATIAIFALSMQIVGWRPRLITLSLYLVYAVLGYHSLRPVINGNVTTVMALFIVCAVWGIRRRRDAAAGILMAFVLAKPNLALVPLLFMSLWTLSVRRWRFVAWLAGSFAFLVLAGMLIIPDWPAQNLANILHYSAYNPPTTIAAALNELLPSLGRWIGYLIYAALSAVLVWEWIKAFGKDFSVFLPAFCLTLVVSQWLWITTDPGNFIILTLPLALVLKFIDESRYGNVLNPALLLLWLVGLWALFLTTFDPSKGNLQSPILFFPLPAALLAGLYLRQQQKQSGEGLPGPGKAVEEGHQV